MQLHVNSVTQKWKYKGILAILYITNKATYQTLYRLRNNLPFKCIEVNAV